MWHLRIFSASSSPSLERCYSFLTSSPLSLSLSVAHLCVIRLQIAYEHGDTVEMNLVSTGVYLRLMDENTGESTQRIKTYEWAKFPLDQEVDIEEEVEPKRDEVEPNLVEDAPEDTDTAMEGVTDSVSRGMKTSEELEESPDGLVEVDMSRVDPEVILNGQIHVYRPEDDLWHAATVVKFVQRTQRHEVGI
jgi:hypothetical protein